MNFDYLMYPKELSKSENEINSFEYDFSFITTDEHLKGLLSNVCNILKHPITIININKDADNLDANRIDSDSVYYALRRSCDTLRTCASSKLCKECDAFHASIFKGLTKDNLEKDLKTLVKNMEKFKFETEYYKSPEVQKGKDGRVFLSYNCPMLGYIELVFPIFFKDKVIATLFVGQIQMKDKKKLHLSTTRAFLKEHSNVFNNYLNSVENASLNKIIKELEKSDFKNSKKSYFENIYKEPIGSINDIRKDNLTKEQFQQLISDVCDQLIIIEDFLERHMEIKRKNFFNNVLRTSEQNFYEKFNPNDLSEDNLKQVKNNFKEYLNYISSNLKLYEIFAFYHDELMTSNNKENHIYLDTNCREEIKTYKFNKVNKFINANQYLPTVSTETESLFKGLNTNTHYNNTNSVIIAFPKMAILISTEEFKDDYTKEIFNIMLSELTQSLSRIYFSIQNLYSGYFKSKYQLILRLYRHECQHISKGLANKNKNYFYDKDYISLNRKKATDIYNDLNSSISLMKGMASSIGLIIGSISAKDININKESISMFKDVLYKWTDMFALPLSEKNISIIVPEVSKFDEERPISITTNKELLEQVIYNIIDNAVKYAYWGSKIYIDFKRPFKNSSIGVLSVINYTPHYIEPGEKAYELYYRGVSAKGRIEGEGIGLFVTKKITEMFDMNLYHTIDKISDYGVPLIKEYINRDLKFYKKNDQLITLLTKETERLKSKGEFWKYEDIINLNKTKSISDIDLAEETIVTYINEPTYKVTFNVELKIKD